MNPTTTTRERALGAYVLHSGVTDASRAIEQAQAGERIGLSTLWISERLGFRDLSVVAGAIGQATTSARIGSAVTWFQTRHPVVLASLASTLQSLTRGRFLLGLGRGGSWLDGLGVVPTAPTEMVKQLVIFMPCSSTDRIADPVLVIRGPDGILFDTFNAPAQAAFTYVFRLLCFLNILVCLVGVLALARYRAMVPLIYLVVLLLFAGMKVLGLLYPIPRASGAPSGMIIIAMLAVTLLGCLLSLLDTRKKQAS